MSMSVPYLKLNFATSVPLRIYEDGTYYAPESHTVTVGLSGARRKPYIQWYLKGWCQGYFRLHHEGKLSADYLSTLLEQVGQSRKFFLNTSFSDLMAPMCAAMEGIVQQLSALSGTKWTYSSDGVQGNTLAQQLSEMDTFCAKHSDLKIESVI